MRIHDAFRLTSVLLIAAACAGSSSAATAPAPASASQVTHVDQTSGTRSLLIAVSPVNENVVWVAGSAGTYVRTTDGGATWLAAKVPGADSLQFRDVHAVDAKTAYLLSIGEGEQSRIYKTTDAGQHWDRQFTNNDPKAFYDCMDFWDAKRGIVTGDAIGSELAILTTSDGGAHWTRIPPATLPPAMTGEGSFAASGLCVTTRPGGHAWIISNTASHSRLLHTTNYGKTWTADTMPLTTHDGTGGASISFHDAQRGIVLGGGTTAKAGDAFTAFTTNGGRTWARGTSPALARGFWGGLFIPGAKMPTVVGVGPNGAVYSRDTGMTWTVIDTNNYWSVGFASPRAGWAVGQNGRITKLSGF